MILVRRAGLLACLAAACLVASPLPAQRPGAVPPRPALWPDADTASAQSYYTHGIALLARDAQQAAAAFYWAMRLQPDWADALYARRVALLMTDRQRLVRYYRGDRRTLESAEILAIDSLQLRAQAIDPFLYRKFDERLYDTYFRASVEDDLRRRGMTNINQGELQRVLDEWKMELPLEWQGRMAYSQARFPASIRYWEDGLRRARYKPYVRAELAHVLYLAGEHDRALSELRTAIDELRERDEREIVYLYDNKALMEHGVAQILHEQGDADAAREAYGRVLQEDLSFHPAHVRLAGLSLEAGDTTAALAAMDLAVQVAPEDGALRHQYGMLLLAAHRYADGAAQLTRATELEPYFAQPYYMLARLHDVATQPHEAAPLYEAFLARTRRDDPLRPGAVQRLEAMRAALADAGPAPEPAPAPEGRR